MMVSDLNMNEQTNNMAELIVKQEPQADYDIPTDIYTRGLRLQNLNNAVITFTEGLGIKIDPDLEKIENKDNLLRLQNLNNAVITFTEGLGIKNDPDLEEIENKNNLELLQEREDDIINSIEDKYDVKIEDSDINSDTSRPLCTGFVRVTTIWPASPTAKRDCSLCCVPLKNSWKEKFKDYTTQIVQNQHRRDSDRNSDTGIDSDQSSEYTRQHDEISLRLLGPCTGFVKITAIWPVNTEIKRNCINCCITNLNYNKTELTETHVVKNNKKPKEKSPRYSKRKINKKTKTKTKKKTKKTIVDLNISYECDICKTIFHNKVVLKKHILQHNYCHMCEKCFKTKYALKLHTRVHTGEKPYKCELCGSVFRILRNLKGHIRQHTGEKPYKCEVCGRDFAEKSTRRIHMRTHTGSRPYKCDICGQSFTQLPSLKNHMRIHIGAKPYVCGVCEKAFKDPYSLKRHEYRHTGEKPYKCNACDKSYADTSGLKKHYIAVHYIRNQSIDIENGLSIPIIDLTNL